ncbi:hypothetical protein EO98_14775 [Methanosarcina sp. 2.H.T.1A.6]|uniref:hypothetical protein n=1 Tax=unclassified Methanosarcina TaxID=2644672 RepID=UPI0006229DE5|nr:MULTISPECIES: hypothetical protein [unclassified Methanosarcina]KKG16763.1 hypothetical protein EO94_00875 [Methanosarcina sp. 2.H.T.1A.3]KKG22778.1 hypothetical protein EO98_14775 [Methanosarcina sp. 2.H.T.1A.6]KKG24492.1 hypothetical protein EO96_15090 [Methanosarcina sp. 2.H.T.1A.8]KKG27532.1 hypothetical protein EO97_14630 [Methanosarcina sp. 2.H.T.1A.15]
MNSNTAVRNLGIGLTVTGLILLVGYALYDIFTTESSLVLKISITAIVAGIGLVLLILIKEKMSVKDKEIERRY